MCVCVRVCVRVCACACVCVCARNEPLGERGGVAGYDGEGGAEGAGRTHLLDHLRRHLADGTKGSEINYVLRIIFDLKIFRIGGSSPSPPGGQDCAAGPGAGRDPASASPSKQSSAFNARLTNTSAL